MVSQAASSGDEMGPVGEPGVEQAAVAVAYGGDDAVAFEDLTSDALQAFALRELVLPRRGRP